MRERCKLPPNVNLVWGGCAQLAYVCHSCHIPHTICNNQPSIIARVGGTSGTTYIQQEYGVSGGYLRQTATHGPTWQWQNHICIYIAIDGCNKSNPHEKCSKKCPKIIQQSKCLEKVFVIENLMRGGGFGC